MTQTIAVRHMQDLVDLQPRAAAICRSIGMESLSTLQLMCAISESAHDLLTPAGAAGSVSIRTLLRKGAVGVAVSLNPEGTDVSRKEIKVWSTSARKEN